MSSRNWLARLRGLWCVSSRRDRRAMAARTRRLPLGVESLEDRVNPATTFDVTTTADAGAGSLRQAILDANATPGADEIDFHIGTGVQTIAALSALPTITDAVVIDGTTQPGFAGTPIVVLSGVAAGAGKNGLTITAANCTVRGLVVNGFSGSGIVLSGSGATGNVIEGNYIGTNPAGTAAVPNATGVSIENGASNNTVGGPGQPALLVGDFDTGAVNRYDPATGRYLGDFASKAGVTAVVDMKIGPDGYLYVASEFANGTYAVLRYDPRTGAYLDTFIPNLGLAPFLEFTPDGHLLVAGDHGPVLRYDAKTGAFVDVFIPATLVDRPRGLAIGPDGLLYVCSYGNDKILRFDLTTGALIDTFASGGQLDGPGNITFGPNGDLFVAAYDGARVLRYDLATGALLASLPDLGVTDVQFGPDGLLYVSGYRQDPPVLRYTSTGAYLGSFLGTAAQSHLAGATELLFATGIGGANVISGNSGDGVLVTGPGTTGNTVAGNYIGLTAAGTAKLGNGNNGVRIELGASNNRIGTNADGVNDAAERNVISGNGTAGVRIWDAGTSGNVVAGNYIGLNAAGTAAIANGSRGVRLMQGASDNVIGGSTAAARNVISGNGNSGVWVTDPGTSRNVVAGNYIGTNAGGTSAIGNGADGVLIESGASDNTVGGNTTGAGNLISGNAGAGLDVTGSGTDRNVIAGNLIGTNAAGSGAITNASVAMYIQFGASDTRVGTDGDGVGDVAERNVIAGHPSGTVYVQGAGTNRTVIAGNYIGINKDGTAALPGGGSGVIVQNGPSDTRIGTDGSDDAFNTNERNVISGNLYNGVAITGLNTTGSVVAGNYIGTNAAGTAAIANRGIGVGIQAPGTRVGTNGDGVRDLEERNVISGNTGSGVDIRGAGADNNVVAGNYIGLSATGSSLGNGGDGVFVSAGVKNTRIGTNGDGVADAAERNVIGGNGAWGIEVQTRNWDGTPFPGGPTTGTVIAGNYVGTDPTGTAAIGNPWGGVMIWQGAQNTRVGTDGNGVADDAERNVISGNAGWGVAISSTGSTGNIVAGNYIGTDVTGTKALGNGSNGVSVGDGAADNRIGTDGNGVADAAERNVIAGNYTGVLVTDPGTDNTIIAGNYIGTDVTGSVAIPNNLGVEVRYGPKKTRIGTDGSNDPFNAVERNVISGNNWWGVYIRTPNWDNTLPPAGGTTDRTVVAGNYIGVAVSGLARLGNGGPGIDVEAGATNTRIGTNGDGVADAEERNVISGNGQHGISVSTRNWDGTPFPGGPTTGTVIAGNYVGTDATGTVALGNSWDGIAIVQGALNTRVGTDGNGVADAAERNVISDNGWGGVSISDTGTTGNVVAGNYIGTDVTGTLPLGNSGEGVSIGGGASNNLVGGGVEAARNVVSGNAASGIGIYSSGTNANRVQGNYIGTNAAGTAVILNGNTGVQVALGATNTVVGTDGDGQSDAGEGNLITGSVYASVVVSGVGTDNTVVAGNLIGTNFDGSAALPGNLGYAGIDVIFGPRGTRIGTNGDGKSDGLERNVISGFSFDGVRVRTLDYNGSAPPGGRVTEGTVIAGNYIGTDRSGTKAIPNAEYGVQIWGGARNTRVGTDGNGVAAVAERNVISGNRFANVHITGSGTTGSVVFGNYIGTDATGTAALGDTGRGVRVAGGATNNTIGDIAPGAGNVITGSRGNGVAVVDAGTVGNSIRGNAIFGNAVPGIDLGGDGITPNDPGDADTGPNQLMNAPVITGVTSGATTRVTGTLDSPGNGPFALDFYANLPTDPAGARQGRRYLGSATVTLAADGAFDVTLPAVLQPGEWVTATATDRSGNTSEFSDRPPVVNPGGPYTVAEGGVITLNASGSDPDGDPLTYAWTVNGHDLPAGTSPTVSLAWADLVGLGVADGPGTFPVSVRVTDGRGGAGDAATSINVTNAPPSVGTITLPTDPVPVGTAISGTATFTDPGVRDTHTAVWDWGDKTTSAGSITETNGSGTVTGSHTYTAAGVYTVCLTVTDKDGDSSPPAVFQYVVVYDASAGFVTGGGWINSPAGAYLPDSSLTGKATFGFVSQYHNGATVPTGDTQFQFNMAGFSFKSTSYDWLVISGAKARYRGMGTVNGAGGYGFELTAWDGQANGGGVDRFRIKIWYGSPGNVVYDNQMGAVDGADPTTALGGGSIVIHK